jgi:glycine/D-amino acid oxidase-like deaminating enzyme
MTLSYWEEDAFWQHIDALVIGGGLVGLQAAIHLKQARPHWRVLVVEQMAGTLGASTRNAGFACFGSLSELADDLTHHPTDAVWDLVAMRWRGLRHLRSTLGDRQIGYQGLGGWEVFTEQDEDSYQRCVDQMPGYNQILREIIGQEEVFARRDEHIAASGLGGTRHLIVNQAEGQLHPGRLMARLMAQARELRIEYWSGLPLAELAVDGEGVRLATAAGWECHARRVLVATNGFARRLLPDLPVSPARNQVILTEPIADLPLRGAFHYDRGYVYFRDVEGRVLLGGGRHLDPEGETTDVFGDSTRIQDYLRKLLLTVILPGRDVAITHQWSGILGVGASKLPIVQALAPQLVVAVRLGGMGVAIGGDIGRQGAELLLEG